MATPASERKPTPPRNSWVEEALYRDGERAGILFMLDNLLTVYSETE